MLKLVRYTLVFLSLTVFIPLFAWAAGFIIFTGTICSMTEPKLPSHTDAAIVLTGGTNRINKGIDLLATGATDNLLVSGVHRDVKINEILALWSKEKKAPPCCITLGREAGNTIGNAQEAKKWLDHIDAKTVTLITANYHMPRALLEFHHELPDLKVIPYPVQPEDFDPKMKIFWKTDFLEYHKLLITLFRIIVFPQETNPLPDAMTK